MNDGIETMTATVEKMTSTSNQMFKDAVEKSMTTLNEVNALSKTNIEAVVESVTAATKGAEAVSAQAVSFGKKNWEDLISVSKSLSTAKSLQEVMEMQSTYAKSALEAYVSEINSLNETLTSSFKNSVQPLNARMTAVVEKFQSVK